jgi:hypothetical protein
MTLLATPAQPKLAPISPNVAPPDPDHLMLRAAVAVLRTQVIDGMQEARKMRRDANSETGDAKHALHLAMRAARPSRRTLHLAYAYLRGRRYAQVEQSNRPDHAPSTAAIWAAVRQAFPSTADAMRICGQDLPMSWVHRGPAPVKAT